MITVSEAKKNVVRANAYMKEILKAAENQDAETLKDMHATITTLEEHARKVKDNTGKIREFTELRIWNLYHLLRLHTESTTPPPEWDEEANWRTVRAVVRDFYDKAQDEERLNKCAEFLEE